MVIIIILSPIYRIHHQKSRYVYELFYKRKAISRGMLESVFVHTTLSWASPLSPELYEYCLDENIADRNLIAKWKKVRKEKERDIGGIALIVMILPP